ncbi:unnamed protein product [Phaedon cochleariae]|uniref:E3 ubiquitin-protein ligase APD1-4 middle domain-containing protein n=1 Tax=Phaedon cochleariae TaxID=80249 RepID=A0A9P0D9P4_PHACE|nr:unnamed protein product [Phaedon cochleariae]
MLISSSNDKISYYRVQKCTSISVLHKKEKMHGVKRVMLFCLMTAVLPTILIITPLYLRHYVFADVTLQVAESDVLLITEGYSSIFCDSLVLRMNSSFNAFQLVGTPRVSKTRRHIRLKKSMSLPDDTLEYWGFYLLKEAMVKLKVCSRHEGSRILVVRGEKNLETCGLLEHNYQKYGAKMDAEYREVKVFDEEPAEILGELEFDLPENNASENMTDDGEAKKRLLSGLIRKKEKNETISQNPPLDAMKVHNDKNMDNTKVRHKKRHTRRKKIEDLKKILNDRQTPLRSKRNISPLDVHIKHGGNAMNYSGDVNAESNSVSSFETDLLRCYDTKILLTRGFVPSYHCNDSDYLGNSVHMVTHHTVASDGYYYYIFYSDNDFVKNEIHAVFDIYKPTYRFANSSIMECINKTECEFPITMLSDETIIVEVPTRDGIEHEDDDITLLKSTCKPRVGVYIIFPILVLFFILACAFV